MAHDLSEPFLSAQERGILLRIARDSLEEGVRTNKYLDLSAYSLTPVLEESHGAFVTLRRGGELRGCVGYMTSACSLAEAVRDNAYNAGLRDTRFSPVKLEELPDIRIEISALRPEEISGSPFTRVRTLDEIVIGRDGVFVERPPWRGGVLLPQVAVERGWNAAQFLAAACVKAGYNADAWKAPETHIYRFSAEVFGED